MGNTWQEKKILWTTTDTATRVMHEKWLRLHECLTWYIVKGLEGMNWYIGARFSWHVYVTGIKTYTHTHTHFVNFLKMWPLTLHQNTWSQKYVLWSLILSHNIPCICFNTRFWLARSCAFKLLKAQVVPVNLLTVLNECSVYKQLQP